MSNRSTIIMAGFSLLVGVLATSVFFSYQETAHSHNSAQSSLSSEPLYWVAPMDANFRRDKPGKSPMGMDLVPVYASDQAGDTPGTVAIDSQVVNNLGVRTAKASMVVLNQSIEALGFVEYNQDTLVHIHARVAGWIETQYIKAEGEYVNKGDPLYALYSPELVNAQEEYLLALSRSNSALIEAAKSRLAALQMPAQSIAELFKTRKLQHRVVFYAPQTGFIDNLNVREGFYVVPSNTMMSIGALDEVWINTQILATHAALVKLDMPVTVSFEHAAGHLFSGKIDYIYPVLDAVNRTLRARVRVSNPDYLLKPNMYAKVDIDTTSMHSPSAVLAVPRHAVIRTGKQNRVVLALGEGKFKSVEVALGQIASDYIEITEGLYEHDEVVISAQFLLDSESSVNSDFMRISHDDGVIDHTGHSGHQQGKKNMSMGMEMSPSVWTSATIIEVMADERKLTLEHGELVAWGMPSMTMDFMVASSVDMLSLRAGMEIHVEIIKTDMPMFTVNTIHITDGHGKDMDAMDDATKGDKP